ncbi:MAG: hypothetical protein IPM25_13735 [Chloracidobacterium sp.]|nr:hypothetical protein [Chloracidobacterium sp.]
MVIKDLGPAVVRAWDGLRPMTKKLLARAMQPGGTGTALPTHKSSYDAHADWEVSRLLTALDEQSRTASVQKDSEKLGEITELAETCVRVLETQSASAEVFIQLAERALRRHDYNRLDKLADLLSLRYSATEVAEVARQAESPQVRAIAFETLSMMPVELLLPLLDDPLYIEIGMASLEQKAFEYESEEAREALENYFPEDDGRNN